MSSNEKVVIYPTENLIVRDPITKLIISKDGYEVELNTYWRRRLQDKDVFIKTNTNKKDKKKNDHI